jgi:adenylate cyclase
MNNDSVIAKNLVVVFMDIHNYSIVINRLGKNKHSPFLQEIYEKLGDIIVEYDGEIIKYMGDAILCVFPADSENDVIQCALHLRKAYSDIIRKRDISQETELEIGITSGPVEVGIFGHKSLRQKDIFGDEVNRAATIGHHRGIAITENVNEKVKFQYKTAKLPELKVKWQDEPLQVWEISERGDDR